MQCIPPDVCLQDVWQWVNNGWFWYKNGEIESPATMQNDGGTLSVMLLNGDVVPYDRRHCFPHWPDCGAVNLQGFAVIVERAQRRQYRRTFNARCLDLTVPRKWDVMKRYPSAKSISLDEVELIAALFSPVYYTYTRALELLDGGWTSVALNPHLIVFGTRDSHVLYYRGKLAATVEQGVVTPNDPTHPRSRRILKWLDGRVRYADSRRNR